MTPRRGSRTLKNIVKARHFIHTLGVDLGGGKGKKTALATLRVDEQGATIVEIAPRAGALPLYDSMLVETIRSHGDDTLLCIDAPLTLPPCLRCEVPVCPGQDECVDRAVVEMRAISAGQHGRASATGAASLRSRRTRSARPRSTSRTGWASCRARRWARAPGRWRRAPRTSRARSRIAFTLNDNLLEVYPKGTLAALGFVRPYKKHLKERETRAEILEALVARAALRPRRVARALHPERSPVRRGHLRVHRLSVGARRLDAARAADAARCVRALDGWIWLPPMPEKAEDAEPTAAEG